jgi:hypothetical protein
MIRCDKNDLKGVYMKSLVALMLLTSIPTLASEMSFEETLGRFNQVSGVIKMPRHPGSNLPFSASSSYSSSPSSEDGVCRALGFERAASGSSRSDKDTEDTIQVDRNGNVVGGPNAYRMTQIVCLNKLSYPTPLDYSVLIKGRELVHKNSGLSFSASSSYSSSPSSEDGVCKSLGFEKSASGSSRSDKQAVDSIQVDRSGNVVGGPNAYRMTQIVCLNPTGIHMGEKSYLLNRKDLIHRSSNLPFSASSSYSSSPSSEDGVCRSLGYSKAASGSSRSDKSAADSVQVNQKGDVVGGPNAYTMTQLVCLMDKARDPQDRPQIPETVLINGSQLRDPSSGMPFSASSSYSSSPSSEDGVCRAMGFSKAVSGSSRSDKVTVDTVQVDSRGVIVAGPNAYRMTQIVCIVR